MKILGLVSAIAVFAVASATDYPSCPKKNLYAQNDLRGKRAPKITVGEWLAGVAPKTAGRVVLVDLWATWCPPCRELIGELNDWSAKFGKRLTIIGISSEQATTVRAFMKNQKMVYNVAVDPDKKVEKAVGVQGIPHVLVISPDGIVRWQGFPLSSDDPLTTEKLSQIISAAGQKS